MNLFNYIDLIDLKKMQVSENANKYTMLEQLQITRNEMEYPLPQNISHKIFLDRGADYKYPFEIFYHHTKKKTTINVTYNTVIGNWTHIYKCKEEQDRIALCICVFNQILDPMINILDVWSHEFQVQMLKEKRKRKYKIESLGDFTIFKEPEFRGTIDWFPEDDMGG